MIWQVRRNNASILKQQSLDGFMTQWTILGPSERSEAVIAKFYLESKKCTSDCESTYVECIIDCQAGTDCQSRCARDYSNCNEHCPCYNFCYEGTLNIKSHFKSHFEWNFSF